MINGVFDGTDEGLYEAYECVQNYIRKFYAEAGGEQYNIRSHVAVIAYVLTKTASDLEHLPHPSVFKQASAFTLNFVLNNPIVTELPDEFYAPEIPRKTFHNALLAFEISRHAIHDAVLFRTDGVKKQLSNKIEPSHHQYGEILKCLATVQPAEEALDTYIRLLALLYESLAYEFNDARYKTILRTGLSDAPLNESVARQ